MVFAGADHMIRSDNAHSETVRYRQVLFGRRPTGALVCLRLFASGELWRQLAAFTNR